MRLTILFAILTGLCGSVLAEAYRAETAELDNSHLSIPNSGKEVKLRDNSHQSITTTDIRYL